QQVQLTELLADEQARDAILDDESLFRALLEKPACLRVSTHFYFYVLARHVLRRAGIEDRTVADYVAELLAEYSDIARTRCVPPGQAKPLDYVFEMLGALQHADEHTTFLLRAHIGNHTLFLAGVFREHIEHRAEYRGAPGLRYYEEVGRANFQMASDHRLARKYDVAGVFATLGDQFRTARLALNDLSDRLLCLSEAGAYLPLLNDPNACN
ncbi:MAG: hypothetical protein AB1705_06175, partial [Verrucomicrobiota bacterium]